MLLTVIAVAVIYLTTFIRFRFGGQYEFVVVFSVNFLLFSYIARHYSPKKLGFYLLLTSVIYAALSLNIHEIPSQTPKFIAQLLGAIFGYGFSHTTKIFKIGFATISLLIMTLYTTTIAQHWYHFVSYHSWAENVDEALPKEWIAVTENKDTISSEKYIGKIAVIDFWNTRCPYCVNGFSSFQNFYDNHKNNRAVIVESINIPWKDESTDAAFKTIKEKKLSFPVAVSTDKLDSVFSIVSYPTTIIIEGQRIIYRGDLKGAERTLNKLQKQAVVTAK